MKLTLICGHDYANTSIIVLHKLREKGYPVSKCLIVSHYSLGRLLSLYRQFDKRELKKKIYDKIGGRFLGSKYISSEAFSIQQIKSEYKLAEKKISSYCLKHGVSYRVVQKMNSPKAYQYLEGQELGVYTGGGIISEKFLECFRLGVLNCHAGKLPLIRGMNATEWSLILNLPTANTLHFMEKKVDLGPIIKLINHDYRNCLSIDELRGQVAVNTIDDLITGVELIVGGKYKLTEQAEEDGKLYYVMHPVMKSLLLKKLQNNLNRTDQ